MADEQQERVLGQTHCIQNIANNDDDDSDVVIN